MLKKKLLLYNWFGLGAISIQLIFNSCVCWEQGSGSCAKTSGCISFKTHKKVSMGHNGCTKKFLVM